MTLNEVLKNTNYDVSLFSEEACKYVEDAIVVKTIRGKEALIIKLLLVIVLSVLILGYMWIHSPM